ncbi:unnamed protein product, partial [Thlaspi arvense]
MHLLKTAIDPSLWASSNRRRSTDGCEAWSSGGGLVLFMTRSVPEEFKLESSRQSFLCQDPSSPESAADEAVPSIRCFRSLSRRVIGLELAGGGKSTLEDDRLVTI